MHMKYSGGKFFVLPKAAPIALRIGLSAILRLETLPRYI